ncbi:MAG: hypothetical protein ACYTG6_15405, partial [Planctomycetota bacterium]
NPPGAPELRIGSAENLKATLLEIRNGRLDGRGVYPVVYPIDDRIELWANPFWLQDWTPRYPMRSQ